MNHSSPLHLFSVLILGLVLGLFPQGALLLSPDGPALSSLAQQLGVDPAGDACRWDGISCEASRVVGITLTILDLTGTLPEAWGQLSKMENLDLSYNSLSGPLPDSWQNWTQLKSFSLKGNNLTGTLPGSWSSFRTLDSLDLGMNKFNGSLPASWSNLTKLITDLNLGGNQLTGSLPASWGNLSHITKLDLSDNNLTGALPDSWQKWTQMGALDLSYNQLTGPLPDSWQKWTKLRELSLRGNKFTGTLPGSWSSLRTLYQINLGLNNLTGSLPASWGNLTKLITNLNLDGNQLTGSLPASWRRLRDLEMMHLQDNHLTGPLPAAWSSLAHLGDFNLSSNHLNGTLPASWSKIFICCINSFDASDNDFHGHIPSSWANLSSVTDLRLDQNELSGPLPDWDSPYGSSVIYLDGNSLTGTLPDAWRKWKDLTLLSLQGNLLNGSLPQSWGARLIPGLTYLDLGDNMLTGELRRSWSKMTNLQYISLAQNSFHGSVPSTWINSTKVKYVNFASNNLSSSIPRLAAGLQLLDMSSNPLLKLSYKRLPRSLKVLRLGNNTLAGPFPDVSLLPANLTILDLSHNLLTGSLPAALPSNLAVLNVTNNDMNGTLPDAWQVPLAEARLGSNKFVGKLPASWSTYGENTSNSLQLSVLDTDIRGPMPQQWVEQFCLAIVKNSSAQVLFSPRVINITSKSGTDIPVTLGSPITLAAQHASINVTLSGDEYMFDYESPGSLCGIPHAQRNAAIFWAVFGTTLIGATVGVTFWLRRKVTSPMTSKLTILAYASSALNHKKARVPKRIAVIIKFFLTDVVWTLYSQVTDAITIHQVFGSGQLLYAYLLLAILLLPFLCIFLLVAIISIRHCRSGQQCGRSLLSRMLHKSAAIVTGVLFAPILFVLMEAAMLTHGFGFILAESLMPTAVDLSTFYRAHAVAEAFLNAFPQAVVQTKLYIVGNDPDGIHVYINTTLFLYSVTGSAIAVLKTVVLMIIEQYQLQCSLVKYFTKLVVFESFNAQGTAVNGQQAGSAMGKTSSGTVLLPQTTMQLATLQQP